MRQSDLSSFTEGRDPRARVFVGEGEDLEPAVSDPPAAAYHGRRCAKCGRPLNGGGLSLVGYGLVCWPCFQQGWGRSG